MANPQRVVVQLGANVEQLVVGMQQAIGVMKGASSGIQAQLQGMSAASASASASMQSAMERTALSVRNLASPLLQLFTIYRLFDTAKGFVQIGIQTNAAMQTAQLGIASLVMAQSTLKNSQGETLTGAAAFNAAMAIGADQVQKLRIAGIQTAATTTQLTDAFKSAVAAGLAAGLSLDQIRDITIRITQAAGAMGMPMDQLRQEVVSILRATIDRNSVVAKNLNLTNEEVKQWKEQGVLADRLLEKLSAFGVAGERVAASWQGVTSNLEEARQVMAAAITAPLFEKLSGALNEALGGIFDLAQGRIAASLSGLVAAGQNLFAGIGDSLKGWIEGAVSALHSLSIWLQENRTRVLAFTSSFGALAGAGTGALGNLLRAVLALANAGLGPLTTLLNTAAALLSSTVVQAGLLAYVVAGPVLNGLRMIVTMGSPLFAIGTSFTRLSETVSGFLGRLQAIPPTFNAFGTMVSAGTTRLQALGSALASSINPWMAAAAAIGVAGFALERYVTAGKRAAEESLRQAQAARAQVDDWQNLTSEATRLDESMRSGTLTAQQRNDASERLRIIMEQLNGLYPGFNALLTDETGRQRSITDALKLANAERSRQIDLKIADARAELAAAEAMVAARAVAMGQSGSFGPMKDVVAAFQGWRLKSDAEAVKVLTKALNELLEAKKALTGAVPDATGLASVTPTAPTEDEGKDKSKELVSKWKDELEAIKTLKENWFAWDNAREIAFWQEKLALTTKGTEAYREIQSTINKLTMQSGREAHEEQLKAAKRMEAAQLESIKQDLAASKERLKIAQEEAREELRIRQEMVRSQEEYALQEVEIEDQHAQAMRDAGLISESQYLEQLRAFEEARYQVKFAAILERQRLDILDEASQIKAAAELARLAQEHRAALQSLSDRGAASGPFASMGKSSKDYSLAKSFGGALDSGIGTIASQWASGLQKMLQGTLTFSNAVKGLWASLRQMVAHVILQMVQEWIAHEIRKLLFSSLTKIKEVALETTSKVAAIAASKGAALAQIPAAAAVAAVNAMASVAAIPMVGWAMAPGVGAATFASAMSFMPAVAAEGGFDIPAGVFPVTQLHEREMVLPAPLAERVRDMTGGGGGGDTIHVNIGGIHALDGASVERVLLDNQGPLAKAIQRAHRDGRFKGK